MITTENIPSNYLPYQSLNFCSNTISGGGHIFAMGKVLPLLIGVGVTPRVWLQAVAVPGSKKFVTIVADSRATHPAVEVNAEGGKLVISVKGITVLAVEANDALCATVSEVDFRPLGLNVFGNPTSLSLGGMQLSHNTFAGVGIAFGLGA